MSSSYLRNSIIATLVYYDIFQSPLTLKEVHKFLINPTRVTQLSGGVGNIDLNDISKELKGLIRSDIIAEKDGYYFLAGRSEICDVRIARQKISDEKWDIFLRYSKWLSFTPYLEAVFASGSMATENTTEESDFDVLVIAKDGRLYTCRFFLWGISSILGIRRKRFEKVAPDKLCFNHYITDEHMNIPHESIFNAQTYVHLKPTLTTSDTIDRFYTSNIWINNYVYNFKVQKDFSGRTIKPNMLSKAVKRFLEFVLNSPLGQWLESVLKKYQQKRIKNNPATYESGGRIVFTDNTLEFHPHSFEAHVISQYNLKLKKMGIILLKDETDSGLLH